MQKLVLVPMFLLVVSGCVSGEDNDSNDTKISMPLLAQCVDDARKTFDDIPGYLEIEAKIFMFDEVIWSHNDVVGYVELSSPVEDYDGLKIVLNGLVFKCYPMERTVVDKQKQDWKDDLIGKLEFLDHLRRKKSYMVSDEDRIEIYYRSPELISK